MYLNSQNDIDEDEILQSRAKKPSHMQPRPSVRSISDMPNIIGIHTTQNNTDVCSYLLICLTWAIVALFFPLSIIFILKVIQEYERGLRAIFSFFKGRIELIYYWIHALNWSISFHLFRETLTLRKMWPF